MRSPLRFRAPLGSVHRLAFWGAPSFLVALAACSGEPSGGGSSSSGCQSLATCCAAASFPSELTPTCSEVVGEGLAGDCAQVESSYATLGYCSGIVSSIPPDSGSDLIADGGKAVVLDTGTPSDQIDAGEGDSNPSGSVNGQTLNPTSSVAVRVTESTTSYVLVALSSAAAATCSALQSNAAMDLDVTYPNATTLELAFEGEVTAGTYEVGAETTADFSQSDSACKPTDVDATAGRITVSVITSSSIQGSFDLLFGASGSLEGTFDVPFCTVTLPTNPTDSCSSG